MKVALKVIGGKNDGREIAISVSRFIIGRGETAHLRPASDLVSREHTAIEIRDGRVLIVDLNSRNGTFVNGIRIAGAVEAESGQAVRIGRLQFEMVIDQVEAGTKKPKVANVVEAASRTASSNPKASLDDSINDWLMEVGDDDPSTAEREILKSADTIQLNFEETTAIRKESVDRAQESSDSDSRSQDSSTSFFGKKAKAKPMKLPPIEKPKHDSSTSAADDVLKKFFNRR
jgi:pSer/pThr/pTyr-binding forkhead associated (FHA) protein